VPGFATNLTHELWQVRLVDKKVENSIIKP